jgi:ATP-dependent Clp protease ATP-binding subunit ClpC
MLGNIPYTPRVKTVLSLATQEAKGLNHTYVGTEHILLDYCAKAMAWPRVC